MKKIVILDGYTTNPGDLSWDGFQSLAYVDSPEDSMKESFFAVYDRTAPDEVIARAKDAEIIISNKIVYTPEVFDQLPKLKYIGLLATGYNTVDLQAAKQRGIVVANVPAYSSDSVAQLVFALMLELFVKVQRQSDSVFAGDWVNAVDFTYSKFEMVEAAGKVMGIVGFGEIGSRVAKIANAFGMPVLVHSRTKKNLAMLENAKWVDLDELLSQSDVITLHTPLTDQTKGLVNKDTLKRMKKSAILINASRGGVVVEQDLADALNEGRIAGAGLDVLSTEPPKSDNPMFSAKNCLITPHVAWATFEARQRLMDVAVNNLKSYLEGNIVNNVAK